MTDTVRVSAPLQLWRGTAHGGIGYVLIGGEAAEAIRGHELMRRLELGKRRGFGSVKVTATIGESRWQTSLVPNKDGSWFLPVKVPVRRAEGLEESDEATVELDLH
jgi:hypothetical protein